MICVNEIDVAVIYKKSYNKKQLRPPSKKRKDGKPKPEYQEGMPHHHYSPHAERRGDRNPKYHEEQQKDVA
jgi:hypothetical protein